MNGMLYPGEVRIASGRSTVLPARILAQRFAAPVVIVKGRIREDEIGFQVFVRIILERAFAIDLRFDPLRLGVATAHPVHKDRQSFAL